MLTKKGEHRIEKRTKARGGKGELILHHLLDKEQLFNKGRLLSLSVLEPGASLGFHEHIGEMEFFYIVSGVAEIFDGRQTYTLYAGDSFYTGDGQGHSIESVGEKKLEYIALILHKD